MLKMMVSTHGTGGGASRWYGSRDHFQTRTDKWRELGGGQGICRNDVVDKGGRGEDRAEKDFTIIKRN